MSDLLDCIRIAITDGATLEQKQAGAAACCGIYASISPPPGVPITVAQTPQAHLGLDQVLYLAIAKLRAMVPAGSEVTTTSVRLPFLATGGKAP
jgi:hypothetical protein